MIPMGRLSTARPSRTLYPVPCTLYPTTQGEALDGFAYVLILGTAFMFAKELLVLIFQHRCICITHAYTCIHMHTYNPNHDHNPNPNPNPNPKPQTRNLTLTHTHTHRRSSKDSRQYRDLQYAALVHVIGQSAFYAAMPAIYLGVSLTRGHLPLWPTGMHAYMHACAYACMSTLASRSRAATCPCGRQACMHTSGS